MFCERCAPLTRQLIFDPAAEPHAELMSGSCMWSDEISREWCIQCIWKQRQWFHVVNPVRRQSQVFGDETVLAAFACSRSHQPAKWDGDVFLCHLLLRPI
jgi:hypothetical protein